MIGSEQPRTVTATFKFNTFGTEEQAKASIDRVNKIISTNLQAKVDLIDFGIVDYRQRPALTILLCELRWR